MASTLDPALPYPLFGGASGGQKKTRDSLSTALTSAATAGGMLKGSEPPSSCQSLSPGKRASIELGALEDAA